MELAGICTQNRDIAIHVLNIHIPDGIGRNLYANLRYGYICTYTLMNLAGICTQNSILGYTVYYI